MKKVSKKEFKRILMSVSCALITATNLHRINDEFWISGVWQEIARTALLGYPQNDLAWFKMTEKYLLDLIKDVQ